MELGDWYFLPHGDSASIVVPVIGYGFGLWGPLPFTYPYFKGVYEIDPSGQMKFYGYEDIREGRIPNYLLRNPLFPRSLARSYADSYSWQHGLFNILFYHVDHIEIVDPSGQRQPFLVLTRDGFYWMAAAEPYGQTYGAGRLIFFDARTGDIGVLRPEKPLLGPIRAVDVNEAANPVKAFGRISLEPLPIFIKGRLYWRVVVCPTELTSISYISLVDAETNEVHRFQTDMEFFRFVAAGEADTTLGAGDRLRMMLGLLEEKGISVRKPSKISPIVSFLEGRATFLKVEDWGPTSSMLSSFVEEWCHKRGSKAVLQWEEAEGNSEYVNFGVLVPVEGVVELHYIRIEVERG